MSIQIDNAFVEQYTSNVEYLLQQMDSRLGSRVRQETQHSKTKFYEQLGTVRAVRRTTRHADTPRVDTPHLRRACYLIDFEISDLVDQQDEIRLLIDPKSAYANNFAMAMHRAKDEVIIEAATGTSYSKVAETDQTTPVELPNSQKIAANHGGGANTGLTLEKLIATKSKMGKNEVPQGSSLVFVHTQQQLDDLLLNVQQVSNADYASVKALVQGEVNYFMGMEFVRTELLDLNPSTNIRTCFAYWENTLLLATGAALKGRISERDDKSYATQVYASQTIGSTRLQEKGVVATYCEEPA